MEQKKTTTLIIPCENLVEQSALFLSSLYEFISGEFLRTIQFQN